MKRVIFLSAPLVFASLSLPLPAPVHAQTRSRSGEDCQQQRETGRRRGRGIGGFLGGVAGAVGGHVGGVTSVVTSVLPVGQLLGEAIAGLLDCREQRQAATATEEAVRGGVGTTSTWESETRPGVTGSSTVIAADTRTVEGDCVTVTDIVIIEGEETRAPKHMCRRPPNNRYVRV
jgi:surface antigen